MGEMTGGGGVGVGERPPSPARLSHSSEKHPKNTLTELNLLRRHRELCDVILNVGTRKIFAHRVILSACSPYFRAMFTGELAESRQTEVTIRDIDELAMDLLIDFCYTSHIVVEESNVQMLLPAACLLQLTEIQDICCEFLKRQLDPSNCLGIRAFADTHSCRELLRIADKFTQHNFQEVMESEEFLLLPVGQLVDIIASDELNVRTEEQVFNAVMSWVKYNVGERRQHLPQVLQHVRLPLLSPKFLVGTVGSDLLVRSDESCRDLVDEAKNYLLLPQERPLMQGPRTRPRKPTRRGEVLFAVGGWCSGDAIASVEKFDPQTMEWKMVAPMSKRRCGVGVAVLNDLLYAVGGHDGQSYLNSIERYDPQTDQWSCDVAPTTSCRTSVGVAVLDNLLYAVGGQDGVQCLNHVERYDPKENKWAKVAPMTTRRLGVAVAVLGGYLYAIGGSDGQSPLNTVERYDPRHNKWTLVSPMSTRRKHLGCAVFNNLIYAVGGRDDCMELSSAERYNPHTNTWSPIVAMTSRRSGPDVRNCQILEKAFLRYQRIIQDDNQAVENHANSLNRVHYEATWIKDPFFVGYLKGLNVSLKGHCELYPSKEVDLLQKERYRIEINRTGAWLESNTVWGILRGLETFSQMVYLAQDEESLRMNLTSITDEARFSHRGLLIDTSRHFIPVKVLCTMLDAMAYNKLNVFHWHIVDDQSFPYVSKRFPKLSEKGAYSQNHIYSVSDVQYIIDYARDRGIRVIPEFDTPGHTRSWGLAYPELLTECYTGTKKNGLLGPIDPTKQRSYTFLKDLFKEIIEVFPDRYIHLGGDEVPFDCWQSNPSIQQFMKEHNLVDYRALESYYVQHLLDMVAAMNSNPIVWEEVFNNGVNISKDTIVHVWYPSRWEKTLYNVTDAGQWALLSGCWYLDIVNSYGDGDWLKYYRCEPTNFNGTHQQAELILGGEACMWAEAVNQYNIIQRVWPRASAAAERLWSPADVRDEAEAKRRLEEHTCRMNRRGIQAQPPNGPGFCRH